MTPKNRNWETGAAVKPEVIMVADGSETLCRTLLHLAGEVRVKKEWLGHIRTNVRESVNRAGL